MLQGKTREQLEENLILPVKQIRRKRNATDNVKRVLFSNNKINEGNTQSLINNPETELREIDWRILILFSEEVYKHSNNSSINPRNYYTEIELKKAKQYTGKLNLKEDISLPLTFDNTTELGFGKYVTIISAKKLSKMSSLLLNYNFDIQREPTKVRRGGETIKEATLVMKNVLEIKNHLKKETLEPTNIVINASIGTSDDGNEINYNSESKQLTINEGTVIDIVDGYHRCKASELALNENPDIDFNFILTILNYSDEKAAKFQGQLAEATPISKPKKRQLSATRNADTIVKSLMNDSELKGRVVVNTKVNSKDGEIVTYDILANTIHEQFKIDRMIDVHNITKYLKTFFDILLGTYEEEFITNPSEYKKHSVMVENNMFIGYVILARKMYEKNIEASEVVEHVKQIDFNRENKLWQEIGFLTNDLILRETLNARRSIKDYFEKIKI